MKNNSLLPTKSEVTIFIFTRILFFLFSILFLTGLIYLVCAYINLQMNPFIWIQSYRIFISFIFMVFFCFGSFACYLVIDDYFRCKRHNPDNKIFQSVLVLLDNDHIKEAMQVLKKSFIDTREYTVHDILYRIEKWGKKKYVKTIKKELKNM